jgi:hypothetical protein
LAPCRTEFTEYLECYLEARFAEEGFSFTCDVDCDGGGGSGGGSGARLSSALAFVVPVLSGAVALAGAGLA